jgi:hypothetical protein
MAVFLARHGLSKREIRSRVSEDYYPLDFKIDEIRNTYRFSETCQKPSLRLLNVSLNQSPSKMQSGPQYLWVEIATPLRQ